MALYIDKQSLDDLSIFPHQGGKKSIFNLFNRTYTFGGAELMEAWFRYPLSDGQEIGRRTALIQYFSEHQVDFPFQGSWFDQAMFYLEMSDERSRLDMDESVFHRRLQALVGADTMYKKVTGGIQSCMHILTTLRELIDAVISSDSLYAQELTHVAIKMTNSGLWQLSKAWDANKRTTHEQVVEMDNILRFTEKETLLGLLQDIYNLDVHLTAARVGKELNFCFPQVDTSGSEKLSYKGVFHPLVPNAKGNDVQLDKQKNILFLTGANMAGKSTFMKAIGVAIYLAHLGFPVPAKALVFSPRDAIYTSINLPDNITMGYSHYYAEVLRIRRVAEQLAKGQKLFVMFDEMFRGTNVKDAYDATFEIVSRIHQNPYCQFVLSTHIIEVGEALEKSCTGIRFVYLPTRLIDGKPVYAYQLTSGITEDRQGMVIVQNEGIVNLLKLPKN